MILGFGSEFARFRIPFVGGMSMIHTCWETSTTPCKTIVRLDGDVSKLKYRSEPLDPTIPYTQLPKELFQLNWSDVGQARWRVEDHITLGESRAILILTQLLATCPGAHRSKFISLQDNQAAAGAFSKGRSSSVQLNYLLRRRCASALAAGLEIILPWTQTTLMPADHLSRNVRGARRPTTT